MADELPTEPTEGAVFTVEGTAYRFIRKLDTVAGAQRLLARCEPSHGPEALVVIKRLPSRARWAQRRRLAHEAWVARRLEHPGLTRVLHAQTSVRCPLLVMEHVEGVRLERVLTWAARRGEHLSPRGAAYLAAEVADALAHAHGITDEAGRPLRLVHRDVSPANITVSRRGEVKLTDLGAVLTRGPGRQRTAAHTLKGAVGYAAPEVLRLERPDARADVFSLGLVLVEMLSGTHLLDLPRQSQPVPVTGHFRKLLGKIWTEQSTWDDPAQLAARAARLRPGDVAQATPHTPVPLRAVAQRALRVNPAERYSTAAELRDALRAYLASTRQGYGPAQLVAEVRKLRIKPRGDRNPVESSQESLPPEFRHAPPVRS